MEPKKLICMSCAHFDDLRPGCAAFLDAIPDEILEGDDDHTTPLEGQDNDLIYTPKKEG